MLSYITYHRLGRDLGPMKSEHRYNASVERLWPEDLDPAHNPDVVALMRRHLRSSSLLTLEEGTIIVVRDPSNIDSDWFAWEITMNGPVPFGWTNTTGRSFIRLGLMLLTQVEGPTGKAEEPF